jgi:hypothetical protein
VKLYLVKCRGMQNSALGSGTGHGTAYVVANDPAEAYQIVFESLRRRDLGFNHDRALDSVQLLAEEGDYPDCGTSLYLKAMGGTAK